MIRCPTCLKVNANQVITPSGAWHRGITPGEHWDLDFTEMKSGIYGYKYLLVFVDTFSGWIEAYPTKETAEITVKKLLTEIVPHFGLPLALVPTMVQPSWLKYLN